MTTYTNQSGSKAVRITQDATGAYRVAYFHIYNGEEKVLFFKSFNSVKYAEKWAIILIGLFIDNL